MNAKELRIGNNCEWSELASMSRTKECIVSLGNIKYARLMNPIELTEDWLIKFNLKDGLFVHNDVFSGFITVKYSKYLSCYEVFIGSVCIRIIKYVHTLQNWWMSNTDQELELKEPVKEASKLTIKELDDFMNNIEDHTPLWNYYLSLKRKLEEGESNGR